MPSAAFGGHRLYTYGMDDPVILQAVLTFWAGILGGCVLGGLVGWRTKFAWGMAVGLLTIGAAGLAGAGWLGWHRYHSLQGTEVVTGVLVEWVTERSKGADNKVTVTHAPVVRFKALDGETYRVKGLGRGGEEDLPPGSAVEVRYRTDDPHQALIADFQNQWAGVWGLGLFGAIPGMMGAFFLATAISEGRQTRRRRMPDKRPLSAQRTQLAQKLTIAGNILLFLSFGFGMFTDNVAKGVGMTFLSVGVACAVHATASVLRQDEWQSAAIFLLIGAAFALFGFGGVMLG